MVEVSIALIAGLVGALVGLAGTLLNLRHERELERQKWIRRESVQSISAFFAQVNEVWRSTHSGGPPLDAIDGPWISCANAYDRATLVVAENETSKLLDELWESLLTIRWEQPDEGIWDEEIWPLMHALKHQVRQSLGAWPTPLPPQTVWRPHWSRLPRRDERMKPKPDVST